MNIHDRDCCHDIREPCDAAEQASRAIRMLNHLTLRPPEPGSSGWVGPAAIYRIVAELSLLVERMPQALDQLARHLENMDGALVHDERPDVAANEAVASVVDSLRDASFECGAVGGELRTALRRLAHLRPG